MRQIYTRHIEVPHLKTFPAQVEAEFYNCARRAFSRTAQTEPLWLDLPGLRSLKLVMMPDAWVVADSALEYLPVLAWTEFSADTHRALHEPVSCQLRYYHNKAQVILEPVKAIMLAQLRSHLGDGAQGDTQNGDVINLPPQR